MNIKACTSKPQIGRDEKTTLRVREGLEMWLLRYTWRVLDACQRIRMTQKMHVLFWCWQLPSSVIAQRGSIYFVWPSVERFAGLGPLRCDSLHGGLALSPGGSPTCCAGDWKGVYPGQNEHRLEQGSWRVGQRNSFSFPSISHEHLHGAILASQLTNKLVEVNFHNLRSTS